MTTNDTTSVTVQLTNAEFAWLRAEREKVEARKRRTEDEVDLADRTRDADDLLCIYANNSHEHKMSPAAEALSSASFHCVQSNNPTEVRLGYVLALDAFLASPDALQQAVRNLRQALVDSDPDLALFKR